MLTNAMMNSQTVSLEPHVSMVMEVLLVPVQLVSLEMAEIGDLVVQVCNYSSNFYDKPLKRSQGICMQGFIQLISIVSMEVALQVAILLDWNDNTDYYN